MSPTSQPQAGSIRPYCLAQVATDAAPTEKLTRAERRVLDKILEGLRNAEAADELFLSVRTVDFHLGNIYRKLNVRDRTQLVLAAMRRSAA